MMDHLPVVIAAETIVLTDEPLIARLRLHTDADPIDVAVNRSAAEAIMRALKDALGPSESHK
jgi:hypothetical protein